MATRHSRSPFQNRLLVWMIHTRMDDHALAEATSIEERLVMLYRTNRKVLPFHHALACRDAFCEADEDLVLSVEDLYSCLPFRWRG